MQLCHCSMNAVLVYQQMGMARLQYNSISKNSHYWYFIVDNSLFICYLNSFLDI